MPLHRRQSAYLAAEAAAGAAGLAAFLCVVLLCFLLLVAGLETASVEAATVAVLAAFGAAVAGACAKDTAATLESKVAAIRDLILNMVGTLITSVAVAPTV